LQGISTSAIAYFSGVESREAAEGLRGQHVELDRAALPALEDGEFYIGDLIGCEVADAASGEQFGRITEATQMPAGVVVEVTVDATQEKFLSSITDEAMPVFDLEGRRVALNLEFLDIQL
jgi:16S rRNA processing protein RimM